MADLSPAAASIVQAFDDRYELLGGLEVNWQEDCLAAALRAAAAQVVPEPGAFISPGTASQIRSELLAIAAELEPVPVSERPWEREGWLDAEGRCWMGHPGDAEFIASWRLCRPEDAPSMTCSLPYGALPMPAPTNNTINQTTH